MILFEIIGYKQFSLQAKICIIGKNKHQQLQSIT